LGDNLHYEKFSNDSVKCIEDEIPFDTASRIYKDIIFDTSPVAGKMYKNNKKQNKKPVCFRINIVEVKEKTL